MKLQKLYVINLRYPTAKIVERELYINVTEKQTWAARFLDAYTYKNMHLLGASAFYTLASAKRAKHALLIKLAQSRFTIYYANGRINLNQRAREQLDLFNKTGEFELPHVAHQQLHRS